MGRYLHCYEFTFLFIDDKLVNLSVGLVTTSARSDELIRIIMVKKIKAHNFVFLYFIYCWASSTPTGMLFMWLLLPLQAKAFLSDRYKTDSLQQQWHTGACIATTSASFDIIQWNMFKSNIWIFLSTQSSKTDRCNMRGFIGQSKQSIYTVFMGVCQSGVLP